MQSPLRSIKLQLSSNGCGLHTVNLDSRGLALFAPTLLNQGSPSPMLELSSVSGVQRRVSTDVRTGVTVNALLTLSKAQLLQQLGRFRPHRLRNSHHYDEQRPILISSKVRRPGASRRERHQPDDCVLQ